MHLMGQKPLFLLCPATEFIFKVYIRFRWESYFSTLVSLPIILIILSQIIFVWNGDENMKKDCLRVPTK